MHHTKMWSSQYISSMKLCVYAQNIAVRKIDKTRYVKRAYFTKVNGRLCKWRVGLFVHLLLEQKARGWIVLVNNGVSKMHVKKC